MEYRFTYEVVIEAEEPDAAVEEFQSQLDAGWHTSKMLNAAEWWQEEE